LINYDSLHYCLINKTLFYLFYSAGWYNAGYSMNDAWITGGASARAKPVNFCVTGYVVCSKVLNQSPELAKLELARRSQTTVILPAVCQSSHINVSTCSQVCSLLSLPLSCTKTHTQGGYKVPFCFLLLVFFFATSGTLHLSGVSRPQTATVYYSFPVTDLGLDLSTVAYLNSFYGGKWLSLNWPKVSTRLGVPLHENRNRAGFWKGWKQSRKRILCHLPWGVLSYLFCLLMMIWPCIPWLGSAPRFLIQSDTFCEIWFLSSCANLRWPHIFKCQM
jgi:hypothetical protein